MYHHIHVDAQVNLLQLVATCPISLEDDVLALINIVGAQTNAQIEGLLAISKTNPCR